MKSWNDRLKHALQLADMKPAELARRCHVSTATVSDWRSGETKQLKAENADKICKVLNLSQSWLLHGKGEMTINQDTAVKQVSESTAEYNLSPRLKAILPELDQEGLNKLDDLAEMVLLQRKAKQ